MLRKWYIELATLLSVIFLSVYLVLQTGHNIDFSKNTTIAVSPKADTVILTSRQVVNLAKKEQWTRGKSLFKSNCASCHNPKADGTGPALQGVTERWNSAGKHKKKTGEQWLYTWVKNWHEVVDAGYPYGIVMARSRTSEMNIFASISEEDVKAILVYVETPDMFNQPLPSVAMPIAK